MRCTLLQAAQRTATPWKNGGGRTWEIAVGPDHAGLDDFDWRISMARVEAEGPFSRFPGVVRTLAMLEGAMRLRVQAQPEVLLDPHSPPWRFDGDAPVHAQVVAPVLDLNLMHRPDCYHAALLRCDAGEARVETPLAFFVAAAAMRLDWVERSGAEVYAELQVHDALQLDEASGAWLRWPKGALGYLIQVAPRPR